MSKLPLWLTITSLCLVLTACGGGGGSSNPVNSANGDSTDNGQNPSNNQEGLFLVAGQASNSGSTDGQGADARFFSVPYSAMYSDSRAAKSLSIDGAGNIYMNDAGAIRKIAPSGRVTILAGMQNMYGNSTGNGSQASFRRSAPIAADDQGNVYVGDVNNLRKVSPDGTVTTVAEIASMTPHSLAVDRNGNFYLSDRSKIIKLAPDGASSTLITYPRDPAWGNWEIVNLIADYDGIVYFTLQYHYGSRHISGGVAPRPLQKISVDGTPGADTNIPKTLQHIDRSGNFYFYEARKIPSTSPEQTEHYLVKRSPDGAVSTVSLFSQSRTTYSSTEDRTPARDPNGALAYPGLTPPVVADTQGNVYYTGEGYLGKVDGNGMASVHAGVLPPSGNADGIGTQARFETTYGITKGPDKSVYVSTPSGIRRIDPAGRVTTILSDRQLRYEKIASDGNGNLYLMDGHALIRISPAGQRTIVAGSKTEYGYTDGTGSQARFPWVVAITTGPEGNIYLMSESTVRKVTPEGVVTTIAGRLSIGPVDGTGSQAGFLAVRDMEIDRAGNLYVFDSHWGCSYYVRKITPSGTVTTLATLQQVDVGAPCESNLAQGGLAIDGEDNLYVLDSYSNLIHKIKQDGSVTKIAGEPNKRFSSPNFSGDLFYTYDIEVIADNTLAVTGGYGVVGVKSSMIGSMPR